MQGVPSNLATDILTTSGGIKDGVAHIDCVTCVLRVSVRSLNHQASAQPSFHSIHSFIVYTMLLAGQLALLGVWLRPTTVASHEATPMTPSLGGFVQSMGWKEVTLLMTSCGDTTGRRLALSIVRSDLRGVKVNCLEVGLVSSGQGTLGNSEGTLAIVEDKGLTDFFGLLDLVNPHNLALFLRRRKLTKHEEDLLANLSITTAFYVAEHWKANFSSAASYSLVHTFKHDKKLVRMEVTFLKASNKEGETMFLPRVNYNLEGARLYCNVITFKPYHIVKKCDNMSRNCIVIGPYADIWRLLEAKYNFTTQVKNPFVMFI